MICRRLSHGTGAPPAVFPVPDRRVPAWRRTASSGTCSPTDPTDSEPKASARSTASMLSISARQGDWLSKLLRNIRSSKHPVALKDRNTSAETLPMGALWPGQPESIPLDSMDKCAR